MKKFIRKIFGVRSEYKGVIKHKVFVIFGVKFKFRVNFCKDKYKFVRTSRPCPLAQFEGFVESKREKVYLSVTAIFKDEPDIIEWIEYHRFAGVERFYLYDNDSEGDYELLLKEYIKSGLVVYKKVIGKCMQKPVYKDAICRYRAETEWMAIIDLDEYIVPVEKDDIKDFLKDYESYPAVVANWIMFDCNGVDKHPEGKIVIETYTRVYRNYQTPINRTIKSIVRPSEVRFVHGVHECDYKKNRLAVDENFNEHISNLCFQTINVSVNKIRINHYHCKSREAYISKINKGFADRKTLRKYDEQKLNFKDTTHDYAVLKYLNGLKNNIEKSSLCHI